MKLAFGAVVFKFLLEGWFHDLNSVFVELRIMISTNEFNKFGLILICFSAGFVVFKLIMLSLMILFSTKRQHVMEFVHEGLKES